MSPAEFKATTIGEQFSRVSDAKVQSAIDMAEAEADAAVLGGVYETYLLNLVAAILSGTPAASTNRISKYSSMTIFDVKLRALEDLKGGGESLL